METENRVMHVDALLFISCFGQLVSNMPFFGQVFFYHRPYLGLHHSWSPRLCVGDKLLCVLWQ